MAIDQISTELIKDDAVTAAKIPAGAVVADVGTGGITDTQLATNAVTGIKIADNAVSLAKMAGGTDGQILTYDASGDPVAVGPGTDGQVLTSTGAGSPPAFEAIPAGGVDGISSSANATAITIGADESVTLSGDFIPLTPMSHRNLIINGAMRVAQRGTSSIATGYQTIDRWFINNSGGTVTKTQGTETSGTVFELGFRKYLRMTNTAGSNAAADYRFAQYALEAQDIANSGWNYKSSSSYITLSFWVRSSVAQNYYGFFDTKDGTAQAYAFETGSLTADTWTKVTKTIPGNTNITIDDDNGAGLQFQISPFSGTNYTNNARSLSTWAAFDSAQRFPDMTSTWASTNGATFDITGVQLELGSSVTPFEHRSLQDELLRCQRYCWRVDSSHNSVRSFAHMFYYHKPSGYDIDVRCSVRHPVPMRTAPTLDVSSGASHFRATFSTASNAGSTQDFLSLINTTTGHTDYSEFSIDTATTGWNSSLLPAPGSVISLGTADTNAYFRYTAEL